MRNFNVSVDRKYNITLSWQSSAGGDAIGRSYELFCEKRDEDCYKYFLTIWEKDSTEDPFKINLNMDSMHKLHEVLSFVLDKR